MEQTGIELVGLEPTELHSQKMKESRTQKRRTYRRHIKWGLLFKIQRMVNQAYISTDWSKDCFNEIST